MSSNPDPIESVRTKTIAALVQLLDEARTAHPDMTVGDFSKAALIGAVQAVASIPGNSYDKATVYLNQVIKFLIENDPDSE